MDHPLLKRSAHATREATAEAPPEDRAATAPGGRLGRAKVIGLVAGATVFTVMLLAPTPSDLSVAGWRTAAAAMLMAVWWMTEAIPISATALLPLVLFPVLGIAPIDDAAAPYAEPIIFLFMGGFMIALAMERWELHRRIALNIIRAIGTRPHSIVLGFIVASAFLSLWISNTATTLMMLPIGLSVVDVARRSGSGAADDAGAGGFGNFAVCLMLGIAYAANIGGIGTLIGTPTNALLAGFMSDTYGVEISFLQWMLVGLPVVVLGLPVMYLALTRLVYPVRMRALPGGREYIDGELARLGGITKPELMVAGVFALVATLWIARPLLSGWIPGASDAGIAMFGALLLFILPVRASQGVFLMNWKHAERLPWGVLILFGGGLTLAGTIQETGLAEWLGGFLTVAGGLPVILIIAIATTLILFLTELTSNSATAAAFMPIMVALAVAVGQNPLLLATAVTIAASCAFMLPVATPPNAIVYGSGLLTIPQMARAGLVLNVLFVFLVTALTYTVAAYIFGIELGVLPEWATPS